MTTRAIAEETAQRFVKGASPALPGARVHAA